jgi:hypothetical protein
MKRKQEETNEERPETRPFAVETTPTLANIPEVLVVSILSFLDYRERSIVRRSCRRLFYSVNSMAPPLNLTLSIQLVPENASTEILQTMRGRTWTASWDKDRALVEMKFKSNLPVSEIPVVKSIRPTWLKVAPLEDVEGRVDARLTHRLATQVAKTVTKLSIVNLTASSVIELQDSLAEFEKEGDCVTELQLSACVPFVHTMSAILRLRKLRSLCLSIRREMIVGWTAFPKSVGLQFAALSALPDLEELTVRAQVIEEDDEVETMMNNGAAIVGHTIGYSANKSLKKLLSHFLHYEGDGVSQRPFATMLHHLTNLESLSILQFPEPGLWRQVHAAGGHEKLQDLAAQLVPMLDVGEMNSFVSACINDFPALQQLEIHFYNVLPFDNNRLVQAVARLKTHPSLMTIKCGWYDDDVKGSFFEDCREALGDGVEVTEIPYGRGV